MDPVQNLYGLATALPQPYTLTLAATLSANRTVTYPDAAITVSGSASALTATRVPYATTGGLLTDAAALTFTVATGLLTATRFESTVATGTAPFTVASTTAVANLNASLLLGQNWGNPGAIGGTTPAAITCTTLTATGAFTSTVNADTSHLCQVINQSAGTSALAALELQNNSGSGCRFRFSDYSSGLTATAFGITLGGYVSTVALGASCNGLIIGCQSIDKPIIFGINTAEVGRWTSAGLTIAGSAAGAASAGTTNIGGGVIQTAGAITAGAGVSCTTLTASGLTSTRIPFATTGGQLTDGSSLTFLTGSDPSLVFGSNTIPASGSTSQITINGAAGSTRRIAIQTGGTLRWRWEYSGTESGSDTGTDLAWYACADNGSIIDAPITIVRATGGLLTTSRPMAINAGFHISNSAAWPSSTYDSYCVIARSSGGGSGGFTQSGAMLYRARLSDTAGRSSHIFYTGATPTERMSINETGIVSIASTADGALTVAGKISAKVAVPASFADFAAVQSYLASIIVPA